MSKNSVQPQDKYVLRLPDGMRERLKISAEKNTRSMNAEIVDRLERSLAGVDESETASADPAAQRKLARLRLKQAVDALDLAEMLE